MSELKNLIESKSHDPYHKKPITEYLKSLTNQHIEFFRYMAEEGYEKYTKYSFLRDTIMKYSKKLFHMIKTEDQQLTNNRNMEVAPFLTDDEIQELVWKWQGNVMEIITGYMFLTNTHPFTDRYTFDEWCGDDKNDVGVDGWLRSNVNKKFFIAIQVKYRFEKAVKWNDQITKALVLTSERIHKMFQEKQLTRDEWCDWGELQKRAVLVTTTKLSDSFSDLTGVNSFDVIDEEVLLTYLGKKHNVNPNKEFWNNLYDCIK